MRKIALTLTLLATALVCAISADPAAAQRVFVAAQGSDANPCTFAQPCRTFQHAHDVVAAGGEIDVLDPAGYGTVTITKAISIQGHGFSGIAVPGGGTGITINAGATDAINLQGLIIEGAGAGTFGVAFNTGESLTVEGCVIRNLTDSGIWFLPTVSSTLAVSKTFIAENNNLAIFVRPSGSATVTAVFNRVELIHNASGGLDVHGGLTTGTVKATVTDSVAATNGGGGFVSTSF